VTGATPHELEAYCHGLSAKEQLRPQDIRAAELVEQVEEADELFQKGAASSRFPGSCNGRHFQ
jgi:hypothetical protein